MTAKDGSHTTKPKPRTGRALDRSIVLVGLMGAGKSSVGRLLAARLGLEFIDADAEIEDAANASIDEIFATHGEATFRSGERRVIARLLEGPARVIATGGGAFMDHDTRKRIQESAISVWLKADLDTLINRVGRRGGRPLLKGKEPRAVLRALMAKRDPVYGTADITVQSSERPAGEVTNLVIQALEQHLGVRPIARPRGHGVARGGLRSRPEGDTAVVNGHAGKGKTKPSPVKGSKRRPSGRRSKAPRGGRGR
ncbi:MAG: shikimate kinase [Alphaproteobacteria bacterium]|nr:shikimate kinase [Alphaproteobacteria bacterium]